jgi:3-hydroxy acid dehydrogenase/malonic semialdehyde reductase
MTKNLTVVITGASSGIGEATAFAFANEGAHLILGARRTEKLNALGPKLKTAGAGSVTVMPLDVTNTNSVAKFAKQIASQCSEGIDILVNNAGLALGVDKIADGKESDWQTMMDTNVMGVLRVTRSLLPDMLARGKGHIINMGSIAGFLVYEGGSGYCASKHAARAVTKTLRLEVNGTPIRVTSIDPGMVETEFSNVRFGDDDKAKAVYKGLEPLTSHDIAECILWSAKRPPHVNIDEIVVMPVAQAAPHKVSRR